ncbi:hypothetical protein L1987_61011 [Smallanthus sonchifolius]|uniref:Uncharacterized protein n=1 Tax=Smallanthus sonchifolius TaxID=185202 RepID=A0ACB9D9K1_9ASTR|nr:hypothetical protein L1987_61011 [Smallanthus sonchifolius]
MFGSLSEEVEVKVAAEKAWQLYGTTKIGDIDVIEGDGGVGTVIMYTMIDNDKMVREAEIIEGGYLDFGFTLYRVRFEVKDNTNDETGSSCVVKTTIEYEVKEEAADNASLAIIEPFVVLMMLANEHLLKIIARPGGRLKLDGFSHPPHSPGSYLEVTAIYCTTANHEVSTGCKYTLR